MEKLEVDSKSGSDEEFFDCMGKYSLKNPLWSAHWIGLLSVSFIIFLDLSVCF